MLNLRKRIARAVTRAGILTLAASSSACTSVSMFIANVPASFGPHTRTADIAYGTEKRQKLDVYVPTESGAATATSTADDSAAARPATVARAGGGASRGRPVVIFWYGGSWQDGSKSEYRFVGAALAERGFVTVLPDYRLYPKVKFPEFLDDAAKAVAWVQQHAQEFGGDPQQIVLMGHSAGAHIAAFMALRPDYLTRAGAKPEWIVGLVGLAGPYAMAPNTRALRTIFGRPYKAADYQPVRFVTRQAPPTFLAHGLDDHLVSFHQTEALRDALRRNDVRVQTELYPDRGHADMVGAFSIPARHRAPVLDDTVKFIESVTSVTPAPLAIPSSAQLSGAR
jgi:acetyl esterase/lipase